MDHNPVARYGLMVDDNGNISGIRCLATGLPFKPLTRWQRFKNWVRSIW